MPSDFGKFVLFDYQQECYAQSNVNIDDQILWQLCNFLNSKCENAYHFLFL